MPTEAWLLLLQGGQLGAAAWHAALENIGPPEDIIAAKRGDLESLGLNAATIDRLKSPDPATLATFQHWLAASNHSLITLDDPHYPALLRQTSAAPTALWIRGSDTTLLAAPQIAVVGSRNATAGGRDTARSFARSLSEHGLTITSGLALGIDAAGHLGGLEGDGSTIAVLGSGIDIVYPRQNEKLAARIGERGLIVSEYPPGVPPQRRHFPARNRIIAGLSVGTLVVEASTRSGSLITARLAGEYGREIFAVPGSIHNPVSRGCHLLIRQGAKLIETADDVLVELAPLLQLPLDAEAQDAGLAAAAAATGLPDEYRQLLECIGFDPTDINEIVNRSTLTTAEVSSMLLLLELEGQVEALPGARYMRKA
jgi:DNA processing protein